MRGRTDLLRITGADFLLRSAYQLGKTPVLPVFAASLGAGEVLVGAILSVSTLTGLLLKPLFGLLSDRRGRVLWLSIGVALFTVVPFLYVFVETPGQLLALRLFHGLATAIFGPVSLAYVAALDDEHRGERLGWFGMARSGGYLVAPALAGWLLTWNEPGQIFTLIGFLSSLAFLPVLTLAPTRRHGQAPKRTWSEEGLIVLRLARSAPALWLAGGLEMLVFVSTYAIKAFLPLYALGAAGFDLLTVGLFFSLQEAALMATRPWGGRFGDRLGQLWAIALGLGLLASGLALLPLLAGAWSLLALALVMGIGMGFVFPATLAVCASQVTGQHLGLGMGLVGSLRNTGKVAGPALGGLYLAAFGYQALFHTCAATLLVLALLVLACLPGSRQRLRT